MIKIEKLETTGWEHAIRGMRNPMNSWNKSDTFYYCYPKDEIPHKIGDNDLKLMKKLVKAGTDHRKFMRMITVYVDITAPLYWWKEFDTYKVGAVCNSCSTMHKITEKPFEMNDFSFEHLEKCLEDDGEICAEPLEDLEYLIDMLNLYRNFYIETKDKKYWWQIIQLLPCSYNQKRTIMLNYEVLSNIYKSRINHKLDEWKTFCKWIETLPYFKELVITNTFTGENLENKNVESIDKNNK